MSYLVTGGRSQTGLVVARLLKEAGKKVTIGSRNGIVPDGYTSVKLDWSDPSTFSLPFADGQTYDGVYLLQPFGLADVSDNMNAFVDVAVEKGVKRFVLLSGSMVDKAGDYGTAKVHRYLEKRGLDFFVLQPTMFIDNFIPMYTKSIKERGEVQSDLPNAKVPMVSVLDIARFAVKALLNDKNERSAQKVVGPELLTFDKMAETLSEILGRKITHEVVSPDEMVAFYTSLPELGWPEPLARMIVGAEKAVDAGCEERLAAQPDNLVGEETFRAWVERVKENVV